MHITGWDFEAVFPVGRGAPAVQAGWAHLLCHETRSGQWVLHRAVCTSLLHSPRLRDPVGLAKKSALISEGFRVKEGSETILGTTVAFACSLAAWLSWILEGCCDPAALQPGWCCECSHLAQLGTDDAFGYTWAQHPHRKGPPCALNGPCVTVVRRSPSTPRGNSIPSPHPGTQFCGPATHAFKKILWTL